MLNYASESDTTMTVRARADDAAPLDLRNAILVQIYPTCLNMGVRFSLRDRPLEIGRSETCELRINHSSVSRRHAAIQPTGNGYSVRDLGSTNGTFVNNAQVEQSPLRDGDSLRVGSCLFRFLSGNNLEAEYHEEIYRLAIIDALTEVHNKRYFLEFLDRELARAVRHRRPLSLVLFDFDHFKQLNDVRGHLCGDHALREVASRVRATTRKEELLARYGGEEFAVVLPDTSSAEAVHVAERIRGLVGGESFEYDREVFEMTVSLGVATTADGPPSTAESLIRQADAALYQAKNAGRDCVRVYSEAEAAGILPRA